MDTYQRKSILFVQFGNVVHQPVIGTVATGAVVPQSILVHVCMTGITGCLGFFENEAGVAIPAIEAGVLTCKGEICPVVMEKAGVKWKA